MTHKYVLDASAILAVLQQESGHEHVIPMLASAMVSAVNATEVLASLVRLGHSPDLARRMFRMLDLAVEPWTEELALESADLGSLALKFGLSLGDRACLTLGRNKRVPCVTADQAWHKIDADFRVRFIR